jgi:ADP-ribose pyrophosphatase
MDYGVTHSEIVYEGKVFRVRIDRVRNPSGKEMQADVVEHHGSVTLLPVDHKQLVWFVRQYRHPIRTSLLELPAGTIDAGEDPEMCAIRECREDERIPFQEVKAMLFQGTIKDAKSIVGLTLALQHFQMI